MVTADGKCPDYPALPYLILRLLPSALNFTEVVKIGCFVPSIDVPRAVERRDPCTSEDTDLNCCNSAYEEQLSLASAAICAAACIFMHSKSSANSPQEAVFTPSGGLT